jgi:hypothetical protein
MSRGMLKRRSLRIEQLLEQATGLRFTLHVSTQILKTNTLNLKISIQDSIEAAAHGLCKAGLAV